MMQTAYAPGDRLAAGAAVLLLTLICLALSFCGDHDSDSARRTADVPPQPSAPQRLVLIDEQQLGAGFNWSTVWLIRDERTGKEFLIARTPNAVAITQIRDVDGGPR